jgi:8-oxo-dGTP diphosphatase
MGGDGDGWVWCAAGHRHWGRYGAAGLLVSDGHRAVLQHRAPWTHEGDTWGLPGGARDSHEDPVSTALREAHEEAAIEGSLIDPIALWITDHGGWSYTTVLAQPRGPLHPHAANAESLDVRWWELDEVELLALHSGFGRSWPFVRTLPPALTIIVAEADLPWPDAQQELSRLARTGIATTTLPSNVTTGDLAVLLPRIVLVTDHTRDEAGKPDMEWWERALIRTSPEQADRITGQVLRVADSSLGAAQPAVPVEWLTAQVDALS